MFDWIEDFIEMFGCDWTTAEQCYHYCNQEAEKNEEIRHD